MPLILPSSSVDCSDPINQAAVDCRKPADKYVVTLIFEVNLQSFTDPDDGVLKGSYLDGVHYLDIDYGHAGFYLTKNDVVETFFSFGPALNSLDKKEGYTGSRHATTSYKITEKSYLFRLQASEAQARRILAEVQKFAAKVAAGEETFHVLMNDTCAESAKQVLDAAKFKTPSASGPVDAGGQGVQWLIGRVIKLLPMANPYKWNENFKKQYGAEGIEFTHTNLRENDPDEDLFPSEKRFLVKSWLRNKGDTDIVNPSQRATLD